MSKYNYFLIILSLLHGISTLGGQTVGRWNIPVTDIKGTTLLNGLSGGLNSPQFSSIFLNSDSLSDLFVFDRSGSKILTFIADSASSKYIHQAEYEAFFPELQEWALLRDFNGDGLQDIFSFSTTGVPGIDVYRGKSDQNGLHFEKIVFNNPVQVLGYPTSSGSIANIFVSAIDIPAIADMDGDGDLDILTFESGGARLYYYRNLSVEKGLGPDTLDFVLEDRCWGKIVESFNTNDVILSADSTQCPTFNQNARLHTGSTVTVFDGDMDGDMDLILGDITFETVLYLENGGIPGNAWIISQTNNFPNGSDRISIPYFPAVYILDINHDGINDILASPNEKDSRENVNVSWYYSGQEENGFLLEDKSFLNNDMLDFGTEANPMFIDYNGDGLMDLVVGSRFHEDYDPANPSQLFLLENTGSLNAPEFTLVEEDWLQLSTLVNEVDALFPTSVDIDGDGDYDLVIGNKFGKLILIENVGIENGPFEMGNVIYPWFDIDVGFGSIPTFVDIDGDGLLDMLVGEERGTINFFRNLGSKEVPLFLPDPKAQENYEEFGDIDTRQNIAVFGMSAPTAFHNQDTTFLLVGTAFGNLLLYDITDVSPTDILIPLSNHPIAGIHEGNRSKPSLSDIDSDGFLEMMVGTARGGINLYKTNFPSGVIVPIREYADPDLITIFPSPALESVFIQSTVFFHRIMLYNTTGTVVMEWNGTDLDLSLPVQNLAPGIYFASILTDRGQVVKSWVKL